MQSVDAGGGQFAGGEREPSCQDCVRVADPGRVSAPATAASDFGAQPVSSTAGPSLARCAAVSGHPAPRAAMNSPARPPPARSAADGNSRSGAASSEDGSLYGSGAAAAPRDCAGCNPYARCSHPRRVWSAATAPAPGLSTAPAGGAVICTPGPRFPAAVASLATRPGNWPSSTATSSSARSPRIRLKSRSQPLGRRSAPLIHRHHRGIARPDQPRGLQPAQARPPCAPAGPCSGSASAPPGTRSSHQARHGWPGRRARTCTDSTADSPDRPGPGPGSAPTRSPRHLPTTSRDVRGRLNNGPAGGVSFGLIHPRSGPFTGAHRLPVGPGHGRSRLAVDAGEQYSKACDAAARPRPSLLSQFLSHSPPSGAVHQRPPPAMFEQVRQWRPSVNTGQHSWKAWRRATDVGGL